MKNTLLFFGIILLAFIFGFTDSVSAQSKKAAVQKQTIVIRGAAYFPDNVRLKKGVPVQLTIIRRSDYECGEEIVFPAYGIRRKLPLNKAVTVRFTPKRAGNFGFMCGMDMMYGKIIVS